MTKLIVVLLMISPQAHAGSWLSNFICKRIMSDDPYQFEGSSNTSLMNAYLKEGKSSALKREQSTLLRILGDQLRANDLRYPLPQEALDMLEDYQSYEKPRG